MKYAAIMLAILVSTSSLNAQTSTLNAQHDTEHNTQRSALKP